MSDPHPSTAAEPHKGVELPASTAAPLVLALGITLLAFGWVTNLTFAIVGAAVFAFGLGKWIVDLLPGRGYVVEPLVEGPRRVVARIGAVGELGHGMPGYRLRLPEKVHPISAGIKGGIAGGLVMPIPAFIYCLVSGHGIWLPINLLAGMVLPGVQYLSVEQLEELDPTLLTVALVIHVAISLMLGTLYGVLMPTLPAIPRPLAWAALLMPLLWTALSFVATSAIDPTVQNLIDWPYFVMSQFVYGVVLASVGMMLDPKRLLVAGLVGGILGGVLMAVPAMLWGYLSGHGIWYPVNLLAVMILPHETSYSVEAIEQFNATWFFAAILFHGALSLGFGVLFGLLLRRLPHIPGPFAWGAMLMPLLWTATSYGLMGIVNPALQQLVDWPWFIVSQFVFGIVAAVVVVRTEEVHIAPAGSGAQHSA
jgi:hypothetical protein